VSSGTPLPTPWSKEAFEAQAREFLKKRRHIRAEKRPEEEMDALFLEQKKADTKLLSDAFSGKVGAFEGALYEAKGYYRPQEDCVMFTRDDVPFCAVCRRAIEKVIDLYTSRQSTARASQRSAASQSSIDSRRPKTGTR
jgi:hypothetical protein